MRIFELSLVFIDCLQFNLFLIPGPTVLSLTHIKREDRSEVDLGKQDTFFISLPETALLLKGKE